MDGFNRWLHTHLWEERLSALEGPRTPHIAATPPSVRAVADGVANGEVAVGAQSGS